MNKREVNIDPRGVKEKVLFQQVLLIYSMFTTVSTIRERGRVLLQVLNQVRERYLRKLPGKLDLSPLEFSPKLRVWVNLAKLQDNVMLQELVEFPLLVGSFPTYQICSPPAHGLLKRNPVPSSHLG